jgi:hypothetical protein
MWFHQNHPLPIYPAWWAKKPEKKHLRIPYLRTMSQLERPISCLICNTTWCPPPRCGDRVAQGI